MYCFFEQSKSIENFYVVPSSEKLGAAWAWAHCNACKRAQHNSKSSSRTSTLTTTDSCSSTAMATTSYDAARGDECVQLASNNAENVQRHQHGGHESDRGVFVGNGGCDHQLVIHSITSSMSTREPVQHPEAAEGCMPCQGHGKVAPVSFGSGVQRHRDVRVEPRCPLTAPTASRACSACGSACVHGPRCDSWHRPLQS